MAAHRSPEDLVNSYEPGKEADELVDTALLASAAEHLQMAADLSPVDRDPIRRGRVLADLAAVLQTLGRHPEAIAAGSEAIEILTPESDPVGCASVGGTLGGLFAAEARWEEAASAFRSALKASELSFHSRLDTVAREEETQRAGNLHRWAAYSLARAGHIEEAALALENGRTRELRRRFGSLYLDERLAELPTNYRDAYDAAAARLSASPLGPASTDAARQLQEALATIRALPGFTDFATGATRDHVFLATEHRWPVLYIDPTPVGTLILLVEHSACGAASLSARFVEVTSTEIFMRLAVGSAAAPTSAPFEEPPGSYLLGIGAAGTAEVPSQLNLILPWLGDVLGCALYEWLNELDSVGVTLIPCGPISTAPLHAATWNREADAYRLMDRFDIRYAPSAIVAATALRRARDRATLPSHLVALADPTEDLPAAIPEILEISTHFADKAACAVGREATWPFLEEAAPDATHLHLSCHARGGLFADSDTLLLLADGPVSLEQLTVLQLQARVTAVSACQTALSTMARLPEESLSIGNAFLAVGSACAIASLWPVDDAATAVLMIRVYELMVRDALRPPEALRRAALWLEAVSSEEVDSFLIRYPRLKEEFARRTANNVAPSEARGRRSCGDPDKPFAHPYCWAGFIASGA